MRLLLDAHLSLEIATSLRADGIDIISLEEWLGGRYRHTPDAQILRAAAGEDRVLVTCDVRTIPSLLKAWASTGQRHVGVVLISRRSIRPNDIGGLIRALRRLEENPPEQPGENQAIYLRASPRE